MPPSRLIRPALLAACLAALAAAPAKAGPAAAPDTLAQRLLACTSCHAPADAPPGAGRDAYFPRIAGKPAGYLYNQLVNFRDGRRQYPLMSYMVAPLPEAYLREIAEHFSRQHPAPPPAQPSDAPPALLARGRQLVLHGDPALKVPACVACHGAQLGGVAPAIPGLLGLPRDYINAQFGAWRNQVRRAAAPDCMAAVAARLSLADVAAVSNWLGAQEVGADTRPATAIARPLPLACGSAPEAGAP